MNKLLIAIKSCQSDRDGGFHDPIRLTWGSQLPPEVDLRFFMGQTDRAVVFYRDDEVLVNAGDDYHSLPQKTVAILNWFLGRDYPCIFLADTDSYVLAKKILFCGFENHDYMGVNTWPWGETRAYDAPNRDGVNFHVPKCYGWASGGFGYFLSRKAAEFVVKETPQIWAEDMFVGQVLGPLIKKGEIRVGNLRQGDVAYHYTRTQAEWSYRPELKWMEQMHARYGQ